jgi:DNA-binding MarR family transcriptional regulator
MPSPTNTRTLRTPDILQCNLLPVRQASRQISRLYDQHLAPAALTSTQFVILALLYANPGMSMRELGAELMLERSALLRTMKPLTRDQLVLTVRRTGSGARQFTFGLTGTGEARYAQARPLWLAAQQAFDQMVGGRFSDALHRQLSGVADAVIVSDPNASAGSPTG